MIITYFRSSSYTRWDFCPQLYFIEYCLGWSGKSNMKADKGTITHKVLEILANLNITKKKNRDIFTDDILGNISVNGVDINKITKDVYNYYSAATPHHDWSTGDYHDCKEWVWKVIKYNDGQFDPRKRNIIAAEPHFDFEIKKPWAKYSYNYDGKVLSGHLALKGTIDLITRLDDGIIEIVDWKTGRRLNWATGEEKTQECFKDDPQLRLYHYAVNQLYNVDQVLVTIYYINDGGPFTVFFDKTDLEKTEQMIRSRFMIIKNVTNPCLNKSWKCSKLCDAGKTTFERTNIKPMVINNQMLTKCEQIKYELDRCQMCDVIDKYKNPDFTIGTYKNPGEV